MRMTCSRSCQDPNPPSEFLQDLGAPSYPLFPQSPLSKHSVSGSPFPFGADTISPLDVSFAVDTSSFKSGSLSGDCLSDCSISDLGNSPGQESYPLADMEQEFCQQQDELFSAGSYPSPGSVTSTPAPWNTPAFYMTSSRNAPGTLTYDSQSLSGQLVPGNESVIYNVANVPTGTPNMPFTSLGSSAYPAEPLPTAASSVSNSWQIYDSVPKPEAVNPSLMRKERSHALPWSRSQTYETTEVVSPQMSDAYEGRYSQSSVSSRKPIRSHHAMEERAMSLFTSSANQGRHLSNSDTPVSDQAALTPASGPIPMYQVEDWSIQGPSFMSDAPINHSEHVYGQLSKSHEAELNSPIGSNLIDADIAPEIETTADAEREVTDEDISAEANVLDVTRKMDPLYNVSPGEDGQYHCPFLAKGNCSHAPTKLKCNYDKYIDAHIKPHRCKNPECRELRFSSTACRLRHEREAHGSHGHGVRPYLCLYPECERSKEGNGFPRSWNRNDHMKRVHDHVVTHADVEEPAPGSSIKSRTAAALATRVSRNSVKRKRTADIVPPEESLKRTKRAAEFQEEEAQMASPTLQQRVDAVQGRWRQQYTEANRQFRELKGPLDLAAARELQATVEALVTSSMQLSDLVGNRSWMVPAQ